MRGDILVLLVVIVAIAWTLMLGAVLHMHTDVQMLPLEMELKHVRDMALLQTPAPYSITSRSIVDPPRDILRRPIMLFNLSNHDANFIANIVPLLDSEIQQTLLASFIPAPTRIRCDDGTIRDTEGNTCITECKCSKGGIAGYGRYCGYMHSGCPGLPPCNSVDRCCMLHDQCVSKYGYADKNCTIALAKCTACIRFAYDVGLVEEEEDSVTPNELAWCKIRESDVADLILADILFLLPGCFGDAEREILSLAVQLECDN